MGFFDRFFGGNASSVKVVNDIYNPSISKPIGINEKSFVDMAEQFKGQVESNVVKFPSELGEEHPFDFSTMEKLYKKFGIYAAVVDKYVDYVWGGGFYVTCEDDRALEIINQFIKDVDFTTLGRQWTKEGLNKGNGFLELGGSPEKGIEGMKVLNANYIYVKRNNMGEIQGFNQYTGAFDKYAKQKVIPFTKDEIAHFAFNIIGDSAYGLGLGYTGLLLVDNYLQLNKDEHYIIKRKANSPLHAKIGIVNGERTIIPKAEDITRFGQEMENMSNKTNWATDPLVELKVVDFGDVGEKFARALEHDFDNLCYAWQMPPVLLGRANVPEGLARVQLEGFQKRIQAIQDELEKIIENQIFKRVLNANGFDVDVEFEWGVPSVMESSARMNIVSELVKSPTTSPALKSMLENELVNLLKLDKDEWEQKKLEQEEKDEEEMERMEERPQPIVPGQNKNFPQKVVPKKEQPKQPKAVLPKPEEKLQEEVKKKIRTKSNYEFQKECKHCTELYEEVNDIQEWLGFNYKQYLGQIKARLKDYDFENIKALNEIEAQAGYLSPSQIEELRDILDNGFSKGLGMKEMAKQVDKKLGLKDLYRMTEDGNIKTGASGLPILAKSADKRSIGIVRSEVTRLANLGAEQYYKDNGITKETWVASFGDRTCEDCEALNGQIFEIGNHPDIPLHPMCRCTLTPLVEIK